MKTKDGFTVAWGRVSMISSGPLASGGKVGLLVARPSPWDGGGDLTGRPVEIATFVPMDKEDMALLGRELLDNFDGRFTRK